MSLRACFLGGGKMAEAMLAGIARRSSGGGDITVEVVDPNAERRAALDATGLTTTPAHASIAGALGGGKSDAFDVVVLAIKPQTFDAAFAQQLAAVLPPHSLVLSIMAGTPVATLSSLLGHGALVRAMPNTPASVGEGMTVWYASAAAAADAGQLAAASRLLGSFGHEIRAADEGYLDMATALSGSGPAYYFSAMEAMVDAGVHMGLPRDMARKMVEHTMLGAVKYGMESQAHPAVLRNDITSPGGTTAFAMNQMERGNFRTVMADAIWAAYDRSRAIGGREFAKQDRMF